MDVLDYLRIIRRRWRLVAAVVALAAVAALVTMPDSASDPGDAQRPATGATYTATATVLRTSTGAGDLPLSTLPVFVASGAVPKAAAKTVGWTKDPNLLGQRMRAEVTDGSSTLALTATGDDPELAARTADAFAEALIKFLGDRARSTAKAQIESLRGQLAKNREDYAGVSGTSDSAQAERDGLDGAYGVIQETITNLQVQSATAGFGMQLLQPASPVPVIGKGAAADTFAAAGSNSPLRHTLILIGFGLVLGLGLALAVERFDTRLRGRDRFEELTRLPVVVGVPMLARRRRGRHEVASVSSPHSAVAEAYRSLRSALLLLPSRPVPELLFDERHVLEPAGSTPTTAVTNPRVVLVTSARAREGKTTTVVNLASALAESGRRVIVLDCDFRNPEAHRYLGVARGRGLSDLLAANQGHPLDSVLQRTLVPSVRLVTAGSSTEHPGALLGTMGTYVDQAKEAADIVLIDAPPVLLANDAIDVMPFVDSVLVVARDASTTASEASRLSHLLGRLQVACLGVVLVGASDAGAAYFGQEDVLRRRRFRSQRDHKSTTGRVTAAGTARGGEDMRGTTELAERLEIGDATVCVIGQGYVGLSVAAGAAQAGMSVHGVDRDAERVAGLATGRNVVPGVDETQFDLAYATGRLSFGTDVSVVSQADVVLICVPTPVVEHRPDLSLVEGAGLAVAPHLTGGTLVVLESTTYPGTTEQLLRPLLEKSGLVAGEDFALAYSPERIDPGNTKYGLRNTPRIVGGLDPDSTALAGAFYRTVVDEVEELSSCRAAEMAKLLENTFRMVNIALVNELATLCAVQGIDTWEVIGAAATKPFGFMPFYPGPGVGGHCIPLDPTYLSWQSRKDAGRPFRLVELAQDINAGMPTYVAHRIVDTLNDRGTTIRGARILGLGVTYKPNVGDVRESAALEVLAALEKRGAEILYADPYVDRVDVGWSAAGRCRGDAGAAGLGRLRRSAHPTHRLRLRRTRRIRRACLRRPQRARPPGPRLGGDPVTTQAETRVLRYRHAPDVLSRSAGDAVLHLPPRRSADAVPHGVRGRTCGTSLGTPRTLEESAEGAR